MVDTSIVEPTLRMKELVQSSEDIEIDNKIPISRYLKSSRELVKSAVTNQEVGNIEKAFVLYLRHMSLILEKLPKHPGWHKADISEIMQAKNRCNSIFEIAEKLKSEIKVKYETEYKNANQKNDNLQSTIRDKDSIDENIEKTSPIDDIDKKFNFTKRESPEDESQDTKLDALFDLDKLRESLSTPK